jgi:phosphohistidine phosphatase SixA
MGLPYDRGMSREILILRHAQAEPQRRDLADFDRRLTEQGRREAAQVRDWIVAHQFRFAAAITSPAVRARETAEIVVGSGNGLRDESAIYEATPGTLIDVIDAAAVPGMVLLVGHNPGLEQVVALLTEGRTGDFRGLPTAGVVRLKLAETGSVEPGTAVLENFWFP